MQDTKFNYVEVSEVKPTEIILMVEASIDRDSFEKWADYNERRVAEENYSDHGGNHVQVNKKLSWEEYYQQPTFQLDVADYLRQKSAKIRRQPDLGRSFRKLVNA